MKGKKIAAVLMSAILLLTVLSTVALAVANDNDEQGKYNFSTSMDYDTTVITSSKQLAADGKTVVKTIRDDYKDFKVDISDPDVQAYITNQYDLSCDDCGAVVSNTYVEPDEFGKAGEYTVRESCTTTYSSSQVTYEGVTIVVSDVDDLMNAYLVNGDVSETLYITKHTVYTIDAMYIPKDVAEPIAINTVKVTDATLSFKAGDAPKFTAKSAEPDLYYVYLEMWTEVGGDKYITSSDFFNRDEELLITEFEEGKEYSYSVWVKPYSIYDDNGDFLGYKTTLSGCKQLVLNGVSINVPADKLDDMEEAGIWTYSMASFTAGDEAPVAPEKPDDVKNPEKPSDIKNPEIPNTDYTSNGITVVLLVLSLLTIAFVPVKKYIKVK